jgi:hypothetical protein
MQLRMRLTTAQLRIGDQYYKHKSITAKSFLSNFAQVIFKMCLFGLHMRVGFCIWQSYKCNFFHIKFRSPSRLLNSYIISYSLTSCVVSDQFACLL